MKYRFSAKEKAIITADLQKEVSENDRKRGIIPGIKSPEYLKRRGFSNVTFYVLDQVNTGSVGSPVWEDHPIVNNPNYTVSYYSGSGTANQQKYTFDALDSPVYDAYYNLFFQFPVTDWKNKFRKLEYYSSGSETDKFYLRPWLASMRSLRKPYVSTFTEFLDVASSVPATITSNKSTYGFSWTPKGLQLARGAPLHRASTWYLSNPFLSAYGGANFKITTEYDPFASDATPTVFSGPIEVYLFPQLLFWWCYTTDHTTRNGDRYTLGMNWQIIPRQSYPNYVEPSWAQSGSQFAPDTDPNSRKADFLAYQKSRSGQRCSKMVITSGSGVVPNTGTETSVSPSTFPVDYYLNNCFTSGITPGDSATMVQPLFLTSKVNPSEQLLGVFKMRGVFYYCWYMSNDTGILGTNSFFTSDGESDSKYYGLQMWP